MVNSCVRSTSVSTKSETNASDRHGLVENHTDTLFPCLPRSPTRTVALLKNGFCGEMRVLRRDFDRSCLFQIKPCFRVLRPVAAVLLRIRALKPYALSS
jgi:hypothetical protein